MKINQASKDLIDIAHSLVPLSLQEPQASYIKALSVAVNELQRIEKKKGNIKISHFNKTVWDRLCPIVKRKIEGESK
jgi:predicted metallo-beta-lactamase superfamily hydrolase